MKILLALTFFRPNVSGLTIYVERLARGLAARGHEVTVLAARHVPDLPSEEELDRGLRVVRVPVLARIGKGLLMPRYAAVASRLIGSADVVNVHLPQLEAPIAAVLARARRTPLVATHHCDLHLPPGPLNRIADELAYGTGWTAARLAARVVAYTDDYARHSRLLRRLEAKTVVIPPPVETPEPSAAAIESFRRAHVPGPGPVIALAGRFAAEKGIETVLGALPRLRERFPGLLVLFAGPTAGVVGEHAYLERLLPAIEAQGGHWRFVGTLDPVSELPAFYAAADCLVLPSLNSTESFGLVQVEAMLAGTPVVVSDLPGVRHAVRATGMGEVVPPGDEEAFASAVERVLTGGTRYVRSRDHVVATLGLDGVIGRYEHLFATAAAR